MPPSPHTSDPLRLAVLGAGRLGTAIAAALSSCPDVVVYGPYGRHDDPYAEFAYPDAVLLCVPDGAIPAVAAQFPDTQTLGHCSGATGLEVLGAHPGFSLHPLTAVTATTTRLAGVGAALDATGQGPRHVAEALAAALEMRVFTVNPEDRATYHAAASVAANFLVTLEAFAERLADSAGLERDLLVPLVRASVENWATLGARRALTGPVARGDVATVRRQRTAVAERAPELLELFDVLTRATEALAGSTEGLPA